MWLCTPKRERNTNICPMVAFIRRKDTHRHRTLPIRQPFSCVANYCPQSPLYNWRIERNAVGSDHFDSVHPVSEHHYQLTRVGIVRGWDGREAITSLLGHTTCVVELQRSVTEPKA